MKPDTAMAEIQRAVAILADVREWLRRHEDRVHEMSASEVHRLAGAQWAALATGDALGSILNAVGRLPLDTFGDDI